jgi:hypothetical protein
MGGILTLGPSVSSSALAIAAVAGSFWLLRYDGALDTYRTPLLLPFPAAGLLMVVFSTTAVAGDRADWRRLSAVVAAAAGAVAATAASLASRNPIYDIHARDVVSLGILAAALVLLAGAATAAGERVRPGAWIRTAWAAAAAMATLALIPRVLLLIH